MRFIFSSIFIALVCVGISGCSDVAGHREGVSLEKSPDNLTVGKVQREIKVGMSNAEVVEILGSPNMVTTDGQRREVWVYDKVSTEMAYSKSGAYGNILILGASKSTGAASRTQKTLTIIIKYDEAGKVRDFAYHSSKF